MLYFPAQTLAAVERDRLRAAERHRLVARIRREQAAPASGRHGRPRWRVFRVSPTTESAS
jgi:hypothetical protein